MTGRIVIPLSEKEMKDLSLGENVSVLIKGSVRSLQGGMSPEDRKKWQDAKDAGDTEAMDWEPPSELEIEVSDITVTGNGKYDSLTDEGKD